MAKLFLATVFFLLALFAPSYFSADDQTHLFHDLALDQAEFNQSLPELDDLKRLDKNQTPV